MEKKRTELFLLTSFFCFFVVLIHTSSEGVAKLPVESEWHKLFFMFNKALSFVVPGFVFLSGLKLTSCYQKKTFSFFPFLKRRILKILLPYSFWYIVYYKFLTSTGFIEPKNIQQHIFSFIMGDLVSPFYFITIIFQFYLLFGIILTFFKKYKYFFMGCIVLQYLYFRYIFLPYDDRFFMSYFIYFALGCVCAKNDIFTKKISKYWIYPCFIFFTYWHVTHAYAANIEGVIYYHWKIFTCLFSISAIAAFYHFSCVMTQVLPSLTIFKAMEECSFYIFLSHCYFLYLCNEYWFQIGMDSILRKFVYNSILVFLGSFFLSFLYVFGKKKWYSIKKKI